MNFIERKYILLLSSKLERFKEIRANLYNFRCPFCKDSEKNKYKARGYIYSRKDEAVYKCHNCGRSHSLQVFLQLLDPNLFAQFKVENFENKFGSPKKNKLFKENVADQFIKQRISKPLKHCVKLSEIEEGNELYVVKQYAISRKIPPKFFSYLYATSSLNNISKEIANVKDRKFPDFPVLVIPFFTWNGKFDYIQCRALTNNAEFRFTTFEVNESGLKVWGIPWIDWTEPVHVFEGAIDAMFVNNAIAIAGASDTKFIQWILTKKRKDEIIFCFDNDYKKNPQVLKIVEKRIDDGFKILLFNKQFKWKDMNAAITTGYWSMPKLNSYIQNRVFYDLKAKLELSSQLKKGRLHENNILNNKGP
jgi:hypothetical protein